MELMPSTRHARNQWSGSNIYFSRRKERWWVERDDFETALGALSSGRRLTSLASSPMILPLGTWGTCGLAGARMARSRGHAWQAQPRHGRAWPGCGHPRLRVTSAASAGCLATSSGMNDRQIQIKAPAPCMSALRTLSLFEAGEMCGGICPAHSSSREHEQP